MQDLELRLSKAVCYFWNTRERQGESQGAATGDKDRGARATVTGGRHCDGFSHLIRELLVDSGIPDAMVFHKRDKHEIGDDLPSWSSRRGLVEARKGTELPGYFRPTKDWDLVAVSDGHLVAGVEFKSQVGSFGNNFNNRTEEALGNATDLWTAYREGAFEPSQRPWLGYFMLLEDAPGSTAPVAVRQSHFKVFTEFKGASYAKRYELLCQRLVRERLYNAACLILSDRANGPSGGYREPNTEVGFRAFAVSLTAHAIAFAKLRKGRR